MGKLKVRLSSGAEQVYEKIMREAAAALDKGETSHPKVKLLRIVDDCLNNKIPHDPFSSERALRGPLAKLFRVKKGRLRICYAASSKAQEIFVLYIAETLRKDGDANDPYAIFTSLVMSGRFDSIFEQLGLKRPARGGNVQPVTLH